MKAFTITMIAIYNIVFIYSVIKKKDIFGMGTIINVAVNLNFLLFLMGWSDFIINEPQLGTYIIINSILIIFIIVMLLSKSPVEKLVKSKEYIVLKDRRIFNNKINIYVFINIIYIALFFLENYIGSRNLFPNIFGIDIHTYSAPLISFVTRAIYVMLFLNYICYENFKEKKYLVFFVIDLILFPVIRGARMNLFMSFFEFGIFFTMYNLSYLIRNKKIIISLVLSAILLVGVGITVGNKRIQNQLENAGIEENLEYSDLIRYNGPQDSMGILPWYYGYFPMSYANLDKTIERIDDGGYRTYGIYTARPILVGLLQFDNLIPNYPDLDLIDEVSEYYTTSATVATGFSEFYLDFGKFAFIGIAIYAFISLAIYNGIKKNINNLPLYSLIAGAWFFMAFQNTMIEVITLYSSIYLLLLFKYCVDDKNTREKIING